MNVILTALAGSAARHVIQIIAAALTTEGLFTANEANTLIGAIGIIGTFAWSQVDAWLKAKKIKTLKK